MRPLTYGQDVPTWAVNVLERFRLGLTDRPASPVKLGRLATASLPAAASWAASLIYDLTLGALKLSDGASWYTLERSLRATTTYDPPNLAAGARDAVQTLTVTGAALGDQADASFSLDLQGLSLRAWVSAANTVSFIFTNPTAGAVDLASGTVAVRARK